MECQIKVGDMRQQDRVADLEDGEVEASREVVRKAGSDEGVDSVVMQTAGEKSCDEFLVQW